MGEFSGTDGLGNSDMIELIGKIVVIAIVLLLFVVVLVFCIHIYARWVLNRRRETDTTTRRRRRFDFAGGHREVAMVPPMRSGLDPSVLKTIPITVFNHQEHSKDGLECAVCLSEVSEGEKARILPKCKHGFHVACIDMWFKSHSTCPICRNLVSDQIQANPSTVIGEVSDSGGNVITTTDAANFPTNVLVWGDEERVSTTTSTTNTNVSAHCVDGNHDPPSSSSSSQSMVVIDIPRRINQDVDQELKSPVLTRLRSLKRLFSGNSRRVSNVSSPRNMDVEQGAEDKADRC